MIKAQVGLLRHHSSYWTLLNKRDIQMVRRVPKTNLAQVGGRGYDSGTKNMTKKKLKKGVQKE